MHPLFKTSAAYTIIPVLFIATLISSCATSSLPVSQTIHAAADTVQAAVRAETDDTTYADWVIPERPEQFLRPRSWDLQHQKIWVRFDFPDERVLGYTELLLTSISSSNNALILDAKTMQIESIRDIETSQMLSFTQDSATVHIELPVTYSHSDTLIIGVDYLATPPSRGLYFVNPSGLQEDVPTQVWTLGQPEDNSFWLPTVDHPAERATQETWISVPDHFTTISNGALIDSRVEPGDSLRTDYWRMDLPHAPYLFALAVGEYEVLEKYSSGVTYSYFVEPEFLPYAEIIYRDTEDMMTFFSDYLGIEYPWSTYAQVPVRNFIASGMENTTASFYFDAIQITRQQALDIEFQDLIAHELIHQWIGNLVTCKDWANLPVNEGFATYFETLYRNHRNGFDEAQWKSMQDREAYFTEAMQFRRPIITNRYHVPEDMYDRHTYEKKGLVLRMLHHQVGDVHWRGAVRQFINANLYEAVDWRDVKSAFEQETGRNLDTFFEQWLLSPGHPEIEVATWYENNEGYVRVEQIQDLQRQPVFDLELDIHYFDENGANHIRTVKLTTADSTYVFDDASGKLGELVVDPDRFVLASYTENLSIADLISRLAHPSITLRHEAIAALSDRTLDMEHTVPQLVEAFQFEISPHIRLALFSLLEPYLGEQHRSFIHGLTHENESNFSVRIRAAQKSAALFGVRDNDYLQRLADDDPSYYVAGYLESLFQKAE
ncbi:MAG: aminopeptidase PepN [Bacteroidetes bacterium HLUCCA01]|nr:MAG: aminopeptidase PepN [Bacteroidetes bacterium HLUCCA01]